MFDKIREYINVKKENKRDIINDLEEIISHIDEIEIDYSSIFKNKNYIDIRSINDFKNKHKNIYDRATAYYHDGMEAKKKLPAKYDDKLKKIISIYNIVDKKRIEHNKKNSNFSLASVENIFNKIGILHPSDAQTNTVLSKEKYLLLTGPIFSGKKSAINAKIEYLKQNNLNENEGFLVLDGNDIIQIANAAKQLLECHGFKEEITPINNEILSKSVYDFIIDNSSNSLYRGRLVDFYLNYYSHGKLVFDFDSRDEFEKYLSFYSPISLNNEIMNNYEDKAVADFLFTMGIEYKYNKEFEPKYMLNGSRMCYKPTFTLPKYNICINIYELNEKQEAFCNKEIYSDDFQEERLKSVTIKLKEQISEIKALHDEQNITLIECYTYQRNNNELLPKLQTALASNGVIFNFMQDEDVLNRIFEIDKNFIRVLIETIKRNSKALIASGENSNTIISLSRNKSKTTSPLYRRRERLLSLIIPYFNYYLSHFKTDEYRYLYNAANYLSSCNINSSLKYLIVNNAENLNPATANFIFKLTEAIDLKVIYSGCDWLCKTGINGSTSAYYMDFGRYFPGFEEIKFNKIYKISKNTYKSISKFALDNTGNFEFKVSFDNQDVNDIKLQNITFNNNEMLKEKLINLINSISFNDSIALVCLYDYEFELYNNILKSINNPSAVKCVLAENLNDEYEHIIWTNTKYSSFGFSYDMIALNDISGIILSRPDSRTFVTDRNLLCKAFSLSKKSFTIICNENDVLEYILELFN